MITLVTPYLWLIAMTIAILGYYMGFIDGYYCPTNPLVASTKQVIRGILFALVIAFIVIQLGCAK